MLLSAVSALVVAQSIFEIPEELMNNPVYTPRLQMIEMSENLKFTVENKGICRVLISP